MFATTIIGIQSCAQSNKHECTMDQELTNVAAYAPGITKVEKIHKNVKTHFCYKNNKK